MRVAPHDHLTWPDERQSAYVAWVRVGALFPVVVITLAVSALRSHDVVGPASGAGLACLALGTLLSVTAGYRRFDHRTMVAIGALDLTAVLAIGSLPGSLAVGALVVVPSLWLSGVLRWRGAALCAVVGAMAIAVALTFDGTSGYEAAGRVSWIAALGLVVAAAMAAIVGLWVGQVDQLEAREAALTSALSALAAHQQRTDTTLHTVDVGLAVVGADGSLTSMNPRFTELTALAFPAGHAGRVGQLGDIYAGDNRTRLERDLLPSVRALEGKPFTDTLWIGDLAPTRRAIEVSGTPFRDSDGNFAGAVIAVHDVTTMMGALRVKDDFVALVSHELRTPLTSIIGNLEVATDLGPDHADQVPRLLAVASRNADRLLQLISDLLTVAQARQTGMRMATKSLDLSLLVEESVAGVAGEARERSVGLTTDIWPELRLVGDRGRLLQMTESLLSNAVKYTRPGGRVRVTLDRAGTDVLLTVDDTGIGVSEADQQQVFTQFFRGRNAEDLALPGVGLGLSISKEIISAHGGTIRLESIEGEGTTVLVTLPSGVGSALY